MATVTIFHNNARDEAGRHEAWSRGYLPGDTVTEVFRYETRAGDPLPLPFAFDLCNVGHESDDRAVTYRARGNWSLCVGDVSPTGQPQPEHRRYRSSLEQHADWLRPQLVHTPGRQPVRQIIQRHGEDCAMCAEHSGSDLTPSPT